MEEWWENGAFFYALRDVLFENAWWLFDWLIDKLIVVLRHGRLWRRSSAALPAVR